MTRYAEEVEPQIFISKLFEIGAALHTEVTKSVLTYNVHCTFATGRGFAATPATSSSYVSNLKLRKNNCSSRIHQYLQLTLLVDNYSFPYHNESLDCIFCYLLLNTPSSRDSSSTALKRTALISEHTRQKLPCLSPSPETSPTLIQASAHMKTHTGTALGVPDTPMAREQAPGYPFHRSVPFAANANYPCTRINHITIHSHDEEEGENFGRC